MFLGYLSLKLFSKQSLHLTFLQWILPMADAGVNQYTFHIEPVDNVEEVCRKVRENGMKVCVLINDIMMDKVVISTTNPSKIFLIIVLST